MKIDPMPKGKELEKGNGVGRSCVSPGVTAVFRTVSWGFVCPAGKNRCSFPVWLFWDHTLENTGMDF